MMRKLATPPEQTRRGAVLVLIALALPVVLILCFMSVNTAYMLLLRTELRVATDAAARAAGSTLAATDDQTLATNAAKDIALLNEVGGTGLVLTDPDIEFGGSSQVNPGNPYTFTVDATPTNATRVNAALANQDLFASGLFDASTFNAAQSATATHANVDICLVLDRSSSMKLYTWENLPLLPGGDPRKCLPPQPGSRWLALDAAVTEFVNVLATTPAVEHVAVVTYSSDYFMSCTPTVTNTAATIDGDLNVDLTTVTNAMTNRSGTVWGGMTEIHSGILAGTAVLTGPSARANARKVMIVLTDGNYTADDPVPYATDTAALGIRVHAITFSDGANQTAMQDVAAEGTGDFYHAPDQATLEDVFRTLAATPVFLTD